MVSTIVVTSALIKVFVLIVAPFRVVIPPVVVSIVWPSTLVVRISNIVLSKGLTDFAFWNPLMVKVTVSGAVVHPPTTEHLSVIQYSWTELSFVYFAPNSPLLVVAPSTTVAAAE